MTWGSGHMASVCKSPPNLDNIQASRECLGNDRTIPVVWAGIYYNVLWRSCGQASWLQNDKYHDIIMSLSVSSKDI